MDFNEYYVKSIYLRVIFFIRTGILNVLQKIFSVYYIAHHGNYLYENKTGK